MVEVCSGRGYHSATELKPNTSSLPRESPERACSLRQLSMRIRSGVISNTELQQASARMLTGNLVDPAYEGACEFQVLCWERNGAQECRSNHA